MGATKTSLAALVIAILALIFAVWPLISPSKGPAISPHIFGQLQTNEISLENQILELQCFVVQLTRRDFSEQDVLRNMRCTELMRRTLDKN